MEKLRFRKRGSLSLSPLSFCFPFRADKGVGRLQSWFSLPRLALFWSSRFGFMQQIRQLLKAEERSTVKLSSEQITALTTEECNAIPFTFWFWDCSVTLAFLFLLFEMSGHLSLYPPSNFYFEPIKGIAFSYWNAVFVFSVWLSLFWVLCNRSTSDPASRLRPWQPRNVAPPIFFVVWGITPRSLVLRFCF